MKKRNLLLLFFLTLCGAFIHFYNLNWGAPFYFHPDERNIASAVSQLQFPRQMNPHFFAYGSLPIYTIYFTGVITNYFSNFLSSTQTAILTVTFEQAILVSRIYSALFATAIIPTLFFIGKKLQDEKTGMLTAFFATASVGFIQFAHFGTFEMWLTFFSVLLFWNCLSLLKEKKFIFVVLLGFTFSILIATKVSSLALAPIPFLVLLTYSFQNTRKSLNFKKFGMLSLLSFLRNLCLVIFITATLYMLTNPYIILDTKDFLSSMQYESHVALGTLPVFYTGNFLDTVPAIYQFLHIYPFLLNPLMTILFILAFTYLLFQTIKTKKSSYLLLIAFYLILFCSQALLFVKWTRYMVPTVPFLYLIMAIALSKLTMQQYHNISFLKPLKTPLLGSIIIICGIFALSYFKTAFITTDTRIQALLFAQHTISIDKQIFAEPADLGIIPFQDAFPHMNTFNFYDLDTNSFDATEEQLQQKIAQAQYLVLPSQRLLQSRIKNPKRFPNGHRFYSSLLSGSLGFQKIYETPCDIFCQITYLGDPVYWWEQTASVFDRPTIFIFKKEI